MGLKSMIRHQTMEMVFPEFILGKIFYNQNVKINTKVGNLFFGKSHLK